MMWVAKTRPSEPARTLRRRETEGGGEMKAHWKSIVMLVIGVLVLGQVVSLRYVMAGGSDRGLDRAAAEAKACHDALEAAAREHQDLINGANALRNTPTLSANDKAMVKLIDQIAKVQQNLITADRHALTAVQSLTEHDRLK